MTIEEKIEYQKKERIEFLDKILNCPASKKIIVAGAGTGKTFSFKKILERNPANNNIALTFIRMLSADMFKSFGDLAEVKTFHAYCKKILHERNGRVDIYPFLTKIIEEDAKYLKLGLNTFDEKFQLLIEDSEEIDFYLFRGDYYEAVSFNDSVYRLYKLLKTDLSILPEFNYILVDEFQDFNLLEVSFINELEKKGKIIIVGDDDQAVYDSRNASPKFLREKYNSDEYTKYELPYCSRCPSAIVEATKHFISKAQTEGHLIDRIEKRYECFLEQKLNENINYPKIITACCTLGTTVAKYVKKEINRIEIKEINESWKEGEEYPTVLIIGSKQYLKIIYDELKDEYPQIQFKQSSEIPYSYLNAYEILLKDINHNLAWRLLINDYMDNEQIREVIEESNKGKSMIECIDPKFIEEQKGIIDILRKIQNGEEINAVEAEEFKLAVGADEKELVEYFEPHENTEEIEIDKTKPSLLLTSFVGSKGLSAGFTFIIGAHNGSIPKNPRNITDIEISQFLVALTRTRKQCQIISNKWFNTPFKNGKRILPYSMSKFVAWLPVEIIEDKGLIKAKDLN